MRAVILVLATVALTAVEPDERGRKPVAPAKPKVNTIWVAIGVDRLVREAGNLKAPLRMSFVVVNDGDKATDANVESSRLIVNGKALVDWPFIVANGPRDARWKSLPPGEHLEFAYDFSEYFTAPDTYRVTWKGDGFESAEMVFRILPPKPLDR